jgi:hypothetical protein
MAASERIQCTHGRNYEELKTFDLIVDDHRSDKLNLTMVIGEKEQRVVGCG